jgi:5-methyltetrahydrofolate--homocysteine methyltransferase
MLQRYDLSLEDFSGYEGCNEMLSLTHPEIVGAIHREYFEAGSDLVTTNTFGANLSALREYDLENRIEELAQAGARIAREIADELSTPQRPRWVLGSMGPGTKLASLGQITYRELRDSYALQAAGMVRGGVDAVLVETSQDILCVRAAVAGAKRAIAEAGVDCPVLVSVTMETTGTMLVGSDISAVVASVASLGIDGLGLNCATGPEDMRNYLRQLADLSPVPLTCMPNAGMPVLSDDGAYYPLGAEEFAGIMRSFVDTYGLALVGGCCGTTPDHIRAVAGALRENSLDAATNAQHDGAQLQHDGGSSLRPEGSSFCALQLRAAQALSQNPDTDSHSSGWVSSLYSATSIAQEISYLSIGERTNASGSKAFREALLAADWDKCVDIARGQAAEGAHVLDLCVDYVGRDGRTDMAELASRISREVDIPLQIDSSDPEVIRIGLENTPGRAIVNSVNLESGTGPGSKFTATMDAVREHGAAVVALCIDEEGQARTAEGKLAIARRIISILTSDYGMDERDIIIDPLTFPVATGQDDARRDALNTMEALALIKAEFPQVHTGLGVSNVSFGLKPAARVVLNSIFLNECRTHGLDTGIVPPARILPLSQIPEDQAQAALDVILDNRSDGDPVERFVSMFEGAAARAQAVIEKSLPIEERLRRHIVGGVVAGLETDLTVALESKTAVQIINEDLLGAMKEVGEAFGAGRMQLPFVLKSAEVMKKSVTFLEPYLDRVDGATKGTLVLATVRGDVHDIGKNLVDIILTNNGYRVVNLGIKQPIADIISAAEEVGADAIGMSGLLVKSTQIMKENLEELNELGLGLRYPVLLGGAALTRAYVEGDLNEVYTGEVRYAHDAFEGLALMDAVMATKDGAGELPTTRVRSVAPAQHLEPVTTRSTITRPIPGQVEVSVLPFTGVREGRATLDEVVPFLDKRALFAAQWGLKSSKDGPSYEDLVASEGEPRLAWWIDLLAEESLLDFQVVWGYWPCFSRGNDLVLVDQPQSFHFPRQSSGNHLCLADYFRDEAEMNQYGPDVVGFQLVTVGEQISQRTAELFKADAYRDYYELHGLSVQLTEAFAEFWHTTVRDELGISASSGERYSFGYPSCPDLSQRQGIIELLKPETIGVTLSEEYQLHPEQSTDAMILHHPEAHYFSVR